MDTMTRKVKRPTACYCCTACRDGFRADRRYGAIYGAIRETDAEGKLTDRWQGWEQHHDNAGQCRYCRADVRRAAPAIYAYPWKAGA